MRRAIDSNCHLQLNRTATRLETFFYPLPLVPGTVFLGVLFGRMVFFVMAVTVPTFVMLAFAVMLAFVVCSPRGARLVMPAFVAPAFAIGKHRLAPLNSRNRRWLQRNAENRPEIARYRLRKCFALPNTSLSWKICSIACRCSELLKPPVEAVARAGAQRRPTLRTCRRNRRLEPFVLLSHRAS
jgi:hypothetical protein